MDTSHGEPKHYGDLIRGATGDLWFLRDDYKSPVPVPNPKVAEAVQSFISTLAAEAPYIDQLPDEICIILDLEFGPLFWCVGFLTRQRLK